MPRVPDEYKEARRAEILSAAHGCFARRGVHATRMSDVAEAAALSTGALYRYFESKDALVAAMAERGREFNRRLLEETSGAGTAVERLEALTEGYLALLGSPGVRETIRVSVQLWGEALVDEAVGRELKRSYRTLVAGVEEIVRDGQDAGEIDASLDAEAVSRTLVAVLNDAGLQHVITDAFDAAAYARVVRTMLGALRTDRPEG